MIIVRYERPRDWIVLQTSDPILREMDWLLDDPLLFKLVHADLSKHYAGTDLGRPSVPIEVTYRLTVLRRRKQWSLRRAQQELEDSPVYRDWVRIYDQSVPHYSTLNELERAICPCTLQWMNERLLVLAQAYELTQGYRLRVDSSVTESNIEHPTDTQPLEEWGESGLGTEFPADSEEIMPWTKRVAVASLLRVPRSSGVRASGVRLSACLT